MEHLQDYLAYMLDVRGFSDQTAIVYRQSLAKFKYWFSLSRPFHDERYLTLSDITEYIAWCSHAGLAPATINLHRTVVSSYYRYCVKYHSYSQNPVEETAPMRQRKLLPLCVLMEDVQKVLAALGDGFYERQLKAIILLMCHCGLRASEVCSLRPTNVKGGYVTVMGKGRKTRTVPCSNVCDQALTQHLQNRDKAGFGDSEWLFLNYKGEQITRSAIYHQIHNSFVETTGKELAHPHALRHTFATYCLSHGITIPQISAWLGHSSFVTTMRYLSIVGHPQNPFNA